MTEGLPQPPFAGEPDEVAEVVLRGIDEGTPVVYAPPIWRAVMTAIKALPRFVMRRAKFQVAPAAGPVSAPARA